MDRFGSSGMGRMNGKEEFCDIENSEASVEQFSRFA